MHELLLKSRIYQVAPGLKNFYQEIIAQIQDSSACFELKKAFV